LITNLFILMTALSEGNEQSLWRELLLRIDSMVLTGLIDSAEASGMRKAVMSNKFSVALAFFDIRQKTDAELLAQLRHFSDGSRK
jgi:hypothetical protein